MKRITIAILMTIAIIAVSTYSVFKIGEFRKESIAALSLCMEAAENGEMEKASEIIQDFSDSWEELQKKMVRFVRHEPLTHISNLASHLTYLSRAKDPALFLAELNELMVGIENLWEDELPLMRNLF